MAWYDRLRDWLEPRLLRLFSLLFRQPTGVATIVEQDDSILAVKFGDRYELPGGLVGRNETPEKAAQREVREETGIEVDIQQRIDQQTGNIDGCPHIFLRGTATGGSLQASLEGIPEWLPRDRIDKVQWRQDHAHLSQYLDTPPEDI